MKHRLAFVVLAAALALNAAAADPAGVRVSRFLPDQPISRAGRPARVAAVLENAGSAAVEVSASLLLSPGVRMVGPAMGPVVRLEEGEERRMVWNIEATEPGSYPLRLEVNAGTARVATAALAMDFLPAVEARKLPYIPEPVPARTKILVGAHHCPLWEADRPEMWANIVKHPERTPALGFYAQENPEVSDWETKWASEHGISFFIYCWYRTSQGGAVKTQFGSAIHDALFKSRFADKMKFTIMWENQSRGKAGVADERDLFGNLLPYWMTNYFQHPSYLKVDGKPLLFIYRPEFLVQDLGGVENVKRAFERMRAVCREAGFAGLHILGEYRGLDPKHLTLMKQLGLDYTFAYCWYVHNSPAPAQAISTQMDYIRKTQQLGILPQVVTVSQAWSGWRDEGSIWKIPPPEFATLLRQAKDFIGTLPSNELGSKMLLLDNWNEWGEGHYLAPYREYGFGYVDAVRKVFSDAPEPHVDLIPEDVGMGPYDAAYKKHTQITEEKRLLLSKKATKPGATEEGLIAWWAFDEEKDSPVALDYAGHRLGGTSREATRTNGLDGSALVCDGGCVQVENHRLLSPTNALSLECWVKTDAAGQDNNWFVNRVYAGGTSTGYRLGVLGGKPCFEVPQKEFSHHLQASTLLPTGRWVHIAGTFDGKLMRIYMDGEERGTMERPGPVKPNDFRVCLGSYEAGHRAHFTGLLDEVKLYSRALSGAEVRSHFQARTNRLAVNQASPSPAAKLSASKLFPADWNPKTAADRVLAGLVKVTAPQVKGAHDAGMVLAGTRAYVISMVNDERSGESAEWPFIYVTLSIVNLETLAVEKIIPVARGGQVYDNETLPPGACFVPRILQKDARTLRCFFASEAPGQRQAQTWFTDFDLPTLKFENRLHRAKLKTAAGVFDMQPKALHDDAVKHGFTRPLRDYGLYFIDSFKEFDGRTYAVVNNFIAGQNALAVANPQLDTFEVLGYYNEPPELKLTESAVNRLPDGTWLAICRQEGGNRNYTFTTSPDGRHWTRNEPRSFVPNGDSSKPTFDKFKGLYYLGWQEATRINRVSRSVFNVEVSADGVKWERKYRFETEKSFQYPTFRLHDGAVWLCVTQGDSAPDRKARIMFGRLE